MWYNLIKEFFPIENSITEYRMIQNNRVGKHGEFGKYDLLRLLFVGLSKELVGQTDEHHLHRLLETLLLPGLILDDRKKILEEEYRIPMGAMLRGG